MKLAFICSLLASFHGYASKDSDAGIFRHRTQQSPDDCRPLLQAILVHV